MLLEQLLLVAKHVATVHMVTGALPYEPAPHTQAILDRRMVKRRNQAATRRVSLHHMLFGSSLMTFV
jgi:hypothetical protein